MIRYVLLLLLFSAFCMAQPSDQLPLIPYPAHLVRADGVFQITPRTAVRFLNRIVEPDVRIFADEVLRLTGVQLRMISGGRPEDGDIVIESPDSNHFTAEAYTLKIEESGIRVAGGRAGIFYALQTICQLLPLGKGGESELPCLLINDAPRYKWRGMHLDVCRHFFPVEFIKRYIDYIAMYKMNTFHWHLTEDQGWRIEIRKYPLLTKVGAYRKGSMIGPYSAQKFDSIPYGGFYTQDQIREIVAYASARHVTIVPEIEMPGHSLAALASYPQLSCTGGPFEVGMAWGVYDDIYCPKEETFSFLEDVLSEVCELFPGPYIHIGGDEAPKTRWNNCTHCKDLMKKEGLKDASELQSYFIRRMEKFLEKKGKQMLGWDEILEGGLAPNAVVMSWRGTEGGIAAAKQHHRVVMTPGGFCYFDHYQGDPASEPVAIGGYTPVDKVYSYEPTPAELAPEERQYILGAQGNVWTEYIDTPNQVEYMALPRMAALAEVVWSPDSVRAYPAFQSRLLRHFALLDTMGVNYSHSIFQIRSEIHPLPDHDGIQISLTSPFGDEGIRYTTDGSVPSWNSAEYTSPINVRNSATIRYAGFEKGEQKSVTSSRVFTISRSTGKSIELRTPPHEDYPANGAFTLVDGIRGDTSRFGLDWLGWWGKDLDATIDLGKTEPITHVAAGFFDGEGSWIYLPKRVELFAGPDSLHMHKIRTVEGDEIRKGGKTVSVTFERTDARFVRVVAENVGKIPEGKPGAGNDAWLFADEIVIE